MRRGWTATRPGSVFRARRGGGPSLTHKPGNRAHAHATPSASDPTPRHIGSPTRRPARKRAAHTARDPAPRPAQDQAPPLARPRLSPPRPHPPPPPPPPAVPPHTRRRDRSRRRRTRGRSGHPPDTSGERGARPGRARRPLGRRPPAPVHGRGDRAFLPEVIGRARARGAYDPRRPQACGPLPWAHDAWLLGSGPRIGPRQRRVRAVSVVSTARTNASLSTVSSHAVCSMSPW